MNAFGDQVSVESRDTPDASREGKMGGKSREGDPHKPLQKGGAKEHRRSRPSSLSRSGGGGVKPWEERYSEQVGTVPAWLQSCDLKIKKKKKKKTKKKKKKKERSLRN